MPQEAMDRPCPRASYDPEADALYVRLSPRRREGPSVEVGNSFVVDVDADGEPVGVEMLNVRARARCATRHLRPRGGRPADEYTVQPSGIPAGEPVPPEDVLGRLTAAGVALGPAVGLGADGRVSATFQVLAESAGQAAAIGAHHFAWAAGVTVTDLAVWAGGADDRPPDR